MPIQLFAEQEKIEIEEMIGKTRILKKEYPNNQNVAEAYDLFKGIYDVYCNTEGQS